MTARLTFRAGTEAQARRLAMLAGCVAIHAPLRRNATAVSAAIPWSEIEAIRAELDAIGFDWRDAHRKLDEAMAKAKADALVARYGADAPQRRKPRA